MRDFAVAEGVMVRIVCKHARGADASPVPAFPVRAAPVRADEHAVAVLAMVLEVESPRGASSVGVRRGPERGIV
jgi:hypothetical protein